MTDHPWARALRYIRVQFAGEAAIAGGDGDGALLARFAERREEAAFAALLQRHGPMVLGLCRRLLGHAQDAEDVFQATFLVLAKKAGSVRKRDSVGSWLHGVARRLALRARAQRSLRGERERAAVAPAPSAASAWQDLEAALDEELGRLPEKFRAPLVLCHLEGHTHEEAARLLGVPLGTVRSRVARARERLRDALSRRGVALSAAAFATAVAAGTAAAAVPPSLFTATLTAAPDPAAAGPRVVALVREGLSLVGAARVRTLGALALAAVFAVGAALAAAGLHGTEPAPEAPETQSPPGEQAKANDDDPLPPGAVARIGTLRFRGAGTLSADGTLLAQPFFQRIDLMDVRTGKIVRSFKTELTGATAIARVTFAPDGKTLAVVGFDNNVHMVDAATGKQLALLKGPPLAMSHTLRLSPAVFSADGRVVVVASIGSGKGQSVYAWDWAAGKQLAPAVELDQHFARFALSADGKTLATWAQRIPGPGEAEEKWLSKDVQLWDLATGKQTGTLPVDTVPTAGMADVAFSPDTKLLALHTAMKEVEVWNVAARKRVATLTCKIGTPMGEAFEYLHFAPDGKRLVVANPDCTVEQWDTGAWKPLPTVKGPQAALFGVVFTPEGKTLAYGVRGQSLALWDATTGASLVERPGHRGAVLAVAFTPDRKALVSVDVTGTVLVSDAANGKELKQHALVPLPHSAFFAALSPDGALVAAETSQADGLRLWDTATGKLVHHFAGTYTGSTGAVAFAPDAKTLALLNADQSISLFDLATFKEVRKLNKPDPQVNVGRAHGQTGLAFSGDGRLLVGVTQSFSMPGSPPAAVVWEVATGKELARVCEEFILALALSADGKTLAVGGHRFVSLRRPDTGKELRRLVCDGSVSALAFSPDGRTLAAGQLVYTKNMEAKVTVWELATYSVRSHYTGHQDNVKALAFTADGGRLASASGDTTVLLWDTAGRR
jgi:RNA polymerase sigma factor (sigma-70 family)